MVCATHLRLLRHLPVPVIGRLFAFLFHLVPFVTLLAFIPISEVTGSRRQTDGSAIRWEITLLRAVHTCRSSAVM
jgi:hypothetical protein